MTIILTVFHVQGFVPVFPVRSLKMPEQVKPGNRSANFLLTMALLIGIISGVNAQDTLVFYPDSSCIAFSNKDIRASLVVERTFALDTNGKKEIIFLIRSEGVGEKKYSVRMYPDSNPEVVQRNHVMRWDLHAIDSVEISAEPDLYKLRFTGSTLQEEPLVSLIPSWVYQSGFLQTAYSLPVYRKPSQKYEILFNGNEGTLSYYKYVRKKPYKPCRESGKSNASSASGNNVDSCCLKSVHTIRPKVGDEIAFRTMGYSRDAFPRLSYAFADRNIEGAERFAGVVMEKFVQGSTEAKTTKKKSDARELSVEQIQHWVNEFTYFKNFINWTNPPGLVYSSYLKAIDSNLVTRYGIRLFQKDRFAENADTLTIDPKAGESVRELDSICNSLLQYATLSINSVQIANHDDFQIALKDKNGDSLFYREFKTRLGFKIDFSAGIFYTALFDRQYYFKDTTVSINGSDTSGAFIGKRNTGAYNIGFGLLSHFYTRTGGFVNVGGTFGFIMDTEIRFRFLLGGSLMLGRQSRVVLSGGLALGQVSQLSDGYDTGYRTNALGQPNFTAKPTDNAVPVSDRFLTSFFFGITYNFAGVNIGGKNGTK